MRYSREIELVMTCWADDESFQAWVSSPALGHGHRLDADRSHQPVAPVGPSTVAAYNVVNPATEQHFGGSLGLIPGLAQMGYIALTAFAINVIVSVLVTFALRALKTPEGSDATIKGDYHMNLFKVMAGEANLLSLWYKSQK